MLLLASVEEVRISFWKNETEEDSKLLKHFSLLCEIDNNKVDNMNMKYIKAKCCSTDLEKKKQLKYQTIVFISFYEKKNQKSE